MMPTSFRGPLNNSALRTRFYWLANFCSISNWLKIFAVSFKKERKCSWLIGYAKQRGQQRACCVVVKLAWQRALAVKESAEGNAALTKKKKTLPAREERRYRCGTGWTQKKTFSFLSFLLCLCWIWWEFHLWKFEWRKTLWLWHWKCRFWWSSILLQWTLSSCLLANSLLTFVTHKQDKHELNKNGLFAMQDTFKFAYLWFCSISDFVLLERTRAREWMSLRAVPVKVSYQIKMRDDCFMKDSFVCAIGRGERVLKLWLLTQIFTKATCADEEKVGHHHIALLFKIYISVLYYFDF